MSSMFLRIVPRARSTSSAVMACFTVASMVASIVFSASASGDSCRTSAWSSKYAGIVEEQELRADRRGFLRLDQRLVQAPGGRVAEHLLEQRDRGGVRMRAGRDMIGNCDELHVAHTPQLTRRSPSCTGSAVYVRGSGRVGFGMRQKMRADQRERLRLVELARNEQARRCRAGNTSGRRPAGDRSARSRDRRGRRWWSGRSCATGTRSTSTRSPSMRAGRVLAHLELVAHHRHLAVQVLPRDEASSPSGRPRARAPSAGFHRSPGRSRSSSCDRTTWCRSAARRARSAPAGCSRCFGVPLNSRCSSRCAMPVSP